MSAQHHNLSLLGLLVTLTLAGCLMPVDEGGGQALVVASCGTDSDCGDGLVCDSKASVCVARDAVAVTAWLRLLPPAQGVAAVEEQYPAMTLSNKEEISITLHRPIRVSGRVLLEGEPLGSQEATIIAVADGSIPDLRIHQDAQARESYQYDYEAGTTEKPGFEFLVNEEKTYDIYVYLSGSGEATAASYPPYHVRWNFSQRDNLVDPYNYTWDIEIPSLASYRHITGCLLSNGDSTEPLVGAKVVAFSEEGGNVSTAVNTDAFGCFDLTVQPPQELVVETYTVRIKPSADNELVPEQIVGEVEVMDDVDIGEVTVDGLHELVPVQVQVTASVDTPRTDELPSKNGAEQAAQWGQEKLETLTTDLLGCTVQLAGQVGDGVLRVERVVVEVSGDVDADAGVVTATSTLEFLVPPRSYVLNVVPPAESRLGLQQMLLQFPLGESEPDPILVTLKEKAATRIEVVDPNGLPVSGATVMAVMSGQGEFPETAPLSSRKYEAAPDEDEEGLYVFALDTGEYTFVIDPPSGLGLPRHIERDCYVHGASQLRHVELAWPAVVTGIVYGTLVTTDDGTDPESGTQPLTGGKEDELYSVGPVPEVKVELYGPDEGEAEADGIAPIPQAAGWTDETGRFLLLLPSG